jgi:chromosome partitioning protein
MYMEKSARPARVIVVGNEKGGSGKSTVAMHVAVALVKARQTVATIDLDARQKSLTHYVDNRRAWGQRIGRELGIARHWCPDASVGGESERCAALVDAVDALAENHGFIVIDTPGHDGAGW